MPASKATIPRPKKAAAKVNGAAKKVAKRAVKVPAHVQKAQAILRELNTARHNKYDAEAARKELQSALLDAMEGMGQKSIKAVTESGGTITGTVVESSTITYDSDGLRKALGAKVFDALCTMALDTKKLDEAVAKGEIDAMVVAKYADEQKRAPFIKVTEKDGS